MKQLSLIPTSNDDDQTPLPLIVAQRWNFPLAHIQTENGMVYAVQDWMRGLVGGDVRNILSKLCKHNPQFESLLTRLPYRATNNKVYHVPYASEEGLMFILIYSRLSRGRNRLVEIRNFIASLSSEYEHLKCRNVDERFTTESKFQAEFTKVYSQNSGIYKIFQYYHTQLERVIDILIQHKLPKNLTVNLLIECKVQNKDFFKAIGQLIAYQAELSQSISNVRWILVIAMPYEIIDDYMREIIPSLPIHLISILNGTIIDIVTEEPFINLIGQQAQQTSEILKMDIATGKQLLANG
jgi:hypothetical protein